MDEKNYEEAISYFSQAIRLEPNKEEAFYERAFAYYLARDYENALLDYDNGIRLDRNPSGFIYSMRGTINSNLGNNHEAISDFTNSLNIEKEHSIYFSRGNAKFKIEDKYGAIADFDNAIDLLRNPIEFIASDYYNNRGNAKLEIKEFRSALNDYNKAILCLGYDEDVKLSELGFYPSALKNPIINRGLANFQLRNFAAAIKNFSNVYEVDKHDVEVLIFRGFAKYYSNDKRGACLDWSLAGEKGSAEAYEHIRQYCN
ncbi:MAG: tetratricopeptide repeat protein [bacterium]